MATCTHPDQRKTAQTLKWSVAEFMNTDKNKPHVNKRRAARLATQPVTVQHPSGLIGQGTGTEKPEIRPLCGRLQYLHQVKEGGQESRQRDLPLPEGQAQVAHKQGRPSTGVRRGRTQCCGIRRPSDFELLGHAFVPTYEKGVKGGPSVRKSFGERFQRGASLRAGLVVKKNSWDSLKRKLKQITKKTRPYSFEERLRKLAEVWRGWVNNYPPIAIGAVSPQS
ncbi:Reverse transcriptase/maturase family protein [Lunatimonas lonarensis]|uniref:Reverse transcriptase/maturase family protein n=1 Tax=Lunatimonas lonarensis TaxID=1232681 RepID=R7ZWK3_9BACT|nr:Reverse transcriptase/maturase family protein [Lunatimonas lonarensis]